MRKVSHDGIDDLFLNVFLQYYHVTLETLELYQPHRNGKTLIGNENLIIFIEYHYKHFLDSNLILETYFDREIVIVKQQGRTNRCFLSLTELKNVPIFVAKDSGNKNYIYGEAIIYSRRPVKMSLDKLCSFLDLSPPLTFEDCPRNVDMFKVEENIAYSDHETPGTSENSILIGIDGDDYYWIPNRDIIKKQFFCTKFPGQCGVYFLNDRNRRRHEAICRVDSKIISKQVGFFDKSRDKSISRFAMGMSLINLNLLLLMVIFQKVLLILGKFILLLGILSRWNRNHLFTMRAVWKHYRIYAV